MDALAFLNRPPAAVGPLYVLHGDEAFLKRQALLAIRERAVGPDADEQAVSVYAGDVATFAQVFGRRAGVAGRALRQAAAPARGRLTNPSV